MSSAPSGKRSGGWAVPLIALLVIAFLGLAVAAAALSVVQTGWNPLVQRETEYVVDHLPAELGPLETKLFGTDPGLPILYVFGDIIREACGGGIFDMSQDVADKIETQGLAFFDGATKGRRLPATFAPWKPTPAPASPEGGTFGRGIECMEPSYRLGQLIYEAHGAEGAYYTFGLGAEIVVLPRQRLLVFTFAD